MRAPWLLLLSEQRKCNSLQVAVVVVVVRDVSTLSTFVVTGGTKRGRGDKIESSSASRSLRLQMLKVLARTGSTNARYSIGVIHKIDF